MRGARPSMPQVRDDRVADILRQWELTATASLPSYTQRTRVPVDVLKLQRNYLPGTQSQSGQKEQDRVVASSDYSTAVDVQQHLAYLVCRNRPGDERHRPARHDRHRCDQIRAYLPAVAPIVQEGSQSCGQQLRSLHV